MNEKDKRGVLEKILKSEKINNSYEKYKQKYKLNKKLIIERIMNELDGLWERFRDIGKLQRFLESFISNHIKDFLIFRTTDKSEIKLSSAVSPLR